MFSLLRKSFLTVSETFFRSVEGLVEDIYIYIYREIMLSRLKYISVASIVIGPFLQQ